MKKSSLKLITSIILACTLSSCSYRGSLQKEIYLEFLKNSQIEDLANEYQIGPNCYSLKTEVGRRLPLLYRSLCQDSKELSLITSSASEQLVIDFAQVLRNMPAAVIRQIRISPDFNKLALIFSPQVGQAPILWVVNLEHATIEKLERINVENVAWGYNSQFLYYLVAEDYRPAKLFAHHTQKNLPDELVLSVSDPSTIISIRNDENSRFLFVTLETPETSDVYWIDLLNSPQKAVQVFPKRQGVKYSVHQYLSGFIIRTNLFHPNYSLYTLPMGKHAWSDATLLLQGDSARFIEDLAVIKNYLVLKTRQLGLAGLTVLNMESHALDTLSLPLSIYTLNLRPIADASANTIDFSLQSFLHPKALYRYNLVSKQMTPIKKTALPVALSKIASQYEEKRLFASAHDSTQIPISFVGYANFPTTTPGKLWLHVYGAYGRSLDPNFLTERFSLLERGVAYALAHVRGGGELGPSWHAQAKRKLKQNSISDLIACAEHLIQQKYAAKGQIILYGKSAGALTATTAALQRPDLFGAVILDSPFLDVIGTMLNTKLPLTERERFEWGNPFDPVELEMMRRYSPLDNISCERYPPFYIRTSYADEVIPITQVLDWVKKARELTQDQISITLSISNFATHTEEDNLYDILQARAKEYAFALN